jgi:crotonobetainyl-CoA:carnitine CoA-transferase CaiB-like acyl-CoA transferase
MDRQPIATKSVAALFIIISPFIHVWWVKELEGLPVTAVLTMQEAVESAHFQERGMIEEFGPGLKRTAFPARIDGAQAAPSAGAPELGEHNDELL